MSLTEPVSIVGMQLRLRAGHSQHPARDRCESRGVRPVAVDPDGRSRAVVCVLRGASGGN